jgi:hypothetical protein
MKKLFFCDVTDDEFQKVSDYVFNKITGMKELNNLEAIKNLTEEDIEILANDCYDINYNAHKEDLTAEHIGCVTGIRHLRDIIRKII